MKSIGEQIIEALEGGLDAMRTGKPMRGHVWCRECGSHQTVNATRCLSEGWPKCCGHTMTIDPPDEDDA